MPSKMEVMTDVEGECTWRCTVTHDVVLEEVWEHETEQVEAGFVFLGIQCDDHH